MSKERIAVLRGGSNQEYELSLRNGTRALDTFKSIGHPVKDIVITRDGEWLYDGYIKEPHHLLSDVDIVFVALHSGHGDDGGALRVIDRMGLPYTGSGAFSSSVALNKHLTKEYLKGSGIQVPQHLKLGRDNITNIMQIVHNISQMFGPSYVIKPVSLGSSNGVTFVPNSGELGAAIKEAFMDHDSILVEEFIKGKNATVGLFENFREEPFYFLPTVEIVLPDNELIYSSELKQNQSADMICPGRFTKIEKEAMNEVALSVHKLLKLDQYSRSDFIVNDDGIYFLEVNTRPDMIESSLTETSMSSIGVTYPEVIQQLINSAKCTR